MSECIFCNIAAGKTGAKLLFQDDRAGFTSSNITKNTFAPIHVLIVPRDHYHSIREVDDEALLGHLFAIAKKVAEEKLGIKQYRLVINTGPEAGQSVFHLHLHLLAGRTMHWPPG